MSIYKEYVELRKQVELLESNLKVKGDECMRFMKDNKQKTAEILDLGKFTIVPRKSFKYSPRIVEQEQELRTKMEEEMVVVNKKYEGEIKELEIAKEDDINQGLAQITILESLRFTPLR